MTLKQDNPLSGEDLFIQEFVVGHHTCRLFFRNKEGLLPCAFCEAKSKLTKLLLKQRIDAYRRGAIHEIKVITDYVDKKNIYEVAPILRERIDALQAQLNQLDKEKHE